MRNLLRLSSAMFLVLSFVAVLEANKEAFGFTMSWTIALFGFAAVVDAIDKLGE